MLNTQELQTGCDTGVGKEYYNYWETMYVTTQSEALRQKAADILKGNKIPLPEKK